MRFSSLLLLTFLSTSCVSQPNAVTHPDACSEARAHIELCLGVAPAADAACNPAHAEAILSTECSALLDDKADRFANLLCELGVFSQCTTPACGTHSPSTVCADYIDRDDCSQCDYYLCREAHAANNGCGETGYYQGFGHHYCRLYKDVVAEHLSAHGQQFAYKVRRCLMVTMERSIPTDSSCSDVAEAAYASHQQCYIDAGFCQLSLEDRVAVLASIAPEDLDLALALRTLADCL